MTTEFRPDGRATLIGSQPLSDYEEATGLILAHTPEIPTWVQLPVYKHEGMVAQFAQGLPGLVQEGDRLWVDTAAESFDEAMLAFFEAYLSVADQDGDWDASRFILTPDTARGFFTLIDALDAGDRDIAAVKGQITGPITFCTSLKDQQGRAVFYNEALRDAAVKLLALKAAWQVRQLKKLQVPVIIFIDEPALAGFGSSEFISISKEEIGTCLGEVIAAVHGQGAMAGVHVCANTDWSLLLDSQVDIVNFDAHGYFDKFILYGRQLKDYLQAGRCLAWGIVPTMDPDVIEAASPDSLWQDWLGKSQQVTDLGVSAETLKAQSLITPSCGTGSCTPGQSEKILVLTRELSRRVRGF